MLAHALLKVTLLERSGDLILAAKPSAKVRRAAPRAAERPVRFEGADSALAGWARAGAQGGTEALGKSPLPVPDLDPADLDVQRKERQLDGTSGPCIPNPIRPFDGEHAVGSPRLNASIPEFLTGVDAVGIDMHKVRKASGIPVHHGERWAVHAGRIAAKACCKPSNQTGLAGTKVSVPTDRTLLYD